VSQSAGDRGLGSIADPGALLEGLFEHSPVAFQVYKADGHCLLVNRAFRTLFGSEPPPEYNVLEDDVLERQGFLELIHRAFAGETTQIPAHWYDPRELRQLEVHEGRRVGIEGTLFPLRDSRRRDSSHRALREGRDSGTRAPCHRRRIGAERRATAAVTEIGGHWTAGRGPRP